MNNSLAIFRFNSKCITSYAIDFAGSKRSLNASNSTHDNQIIGWDKGTYSLIAEIHSYDIDSNVLNKIWGNRLHLSKGLKSMVSLLPRKEHDNSPYFIPDKQPSKFNVEIFLKLFMKTCLEIFRSS